METLFDDYNWEQGALTQLYKEYQSILWQHKVKLRAVALQLFDSNTHWGKWDPTTRTIFIAKKLIQNHSWFHVQSILRHEMAHQLVDELYGSSAGEQKPHGELFQLACRRLGVFQEFTKASAHLQESPLDWQSEKRDEASEKLLDKVQKLLALATSSNEHEALLAMNKVRELYAKYNLEQTLNQTEQKGKLTFAHILINGKKKRIERYQNRITSILVEFFFVNILVFPLFDAKSGEKHQVIEIIGTRENALMAEYVYHFLIQQLEFWIRESIKTSKRTISRLERNSFRLGILEGFTEKLKQAETSPTSTDPLKSSLNRQTRELSVIGQAIMKFKSNPELQTYLTEVYPRIYQRTSSGYRMDHSAFAAGEKIGRTISLNKAVTSESKNYGRLLNG